MATREWVNISSGNPPVRLQTASDLKYPVLGVEIFDLKC
jgi:hypothetical protein